VVSQWTGIPVTKLTQGEQERLIHMEDNLHQRVVDVLNLLAKYEINSVTFTDLLDEE
jgi:ATP-dependent Clp protease ATP-binding subunit ClpA